MPGRPALTALAVAGAVAGLALGQDAPRLRRITIDRGDVFDDATADANLVYTLANALHVVTDEDVIRREVWLQPGTRVTAEDTAELGRNLRAFGLFGEAEAHLQPVGNDEADLAVRTRDRFSLGASASVARVGGVQRYAMRLSDSNLMGTGKAVSAVAARSDDDRLDAVRYFDRQFLGSWHTLDVSTGTTDEGSFTEVDLTRPFHHLGDPWTYGVNFATATEQVDYYRRGDTTAEVPIDRTSVRLFAASGTGPRDQRSALGLDLRLQDRDFEPALGADAGRLHVPGDTREIEFGPYWTLDWRPRFDKVRGLDAFDYDEDLTLGVHAGTRLAARWRDETGVGSELQPVADLDLRSAFTPIDSAYLTIAASALGHAGEDRLQGWRSGTALHAYWLGLRPATLAASVTWDAVAEHQDLEPQLTLGEDNGLRGYPAREFAGHRRVRLNCENRLDTGLELLSIHLGVCTFFDAGWIDDGTASLTLGDSLRSAGCGLRFGSSHLLGNRVLRLDVAWPLDRVDDNGYGPSVSLAIGQVFGFFGNQNALSTEF